MAFFKFGKKKKEESLDLPMDMPMPETQSSSPFEQVMMMKQQGYTNNQIVQILQSQGYNNSQIYDALNQANMSATQAAQQDTGMPDYGQSYEQPYPQPEPPVRETPAPMPSVDEQRIQEVAEAIIDEKWDEFAGDIKRVIEWKEKTDDRIAKLEQQIIDLKMAIDSLTKSMMGKIQAYDQNIVDVGTEIKAMEKVFQKVLPSLTENVNKLERMSKGAKEPQKK